MKPKFEIVLSDTKQITERSAFTVMMILGELGGVYGAIVGLPSIFISYIVQLQFMSAIAEFMPVKREADSVLDPVAPDLRDQLIELELTSDMP